MWTIAINQVKHMWNKQFSGKQLWQKLGTLATAIVLVFCLSACGGDKATTNKSRVSGNIAEVSPPSEIQKLSRLLDRYEPQVKILSPKPDEVIADTKVAIKFDVADLPIFKNPTLGLGPHIHVILDNQEYKALYDLNQPLVFENLPAGTHSLRAFASRPWHESFKNDGAYAQVIFHIFTKTGENTPDPQAPLLTYSRPVGTYGAEPVMLDFYLRNAPLHLAALDDDTSSDWQIRATVNGQSFSLDRWQPVYLKGLKSGKNWVRLEFLDDQGNLVANQFNSTAHQINYEPNGTDTLSRLVRGEVIAGIEGIVDPNYTPPTPPPQPVAEPIPQPQEPALSVPAIPAPAPKAISEPQPELVVPVPVPVPAPVQVSPEVKAPESQKIEPKPEPKPEVKSEVKSQPLTPAPVAPVETTAPKPEPVAPAANSAVEKTAPVKKKQATSKPSEPSAQNWFQKLLPNKPKDTKPVKTQSVKEETQVETTTPKLEPKTTESKQAAKAEPKAVEPKALSKPTPKKVEPKAEPNAFSKPVPKKVEPKAEPKLVEPKVSSPPVPKPVEPKPELKPAVKPAETVRTSTSVQALRERLRKARANQSAPEETKTQDASGGAIAIPESLSLP